MRKRTKNENEGKVPGGVTWSHAGGWSSRPTPLAVMVCYRGKGERRGREKGQIREIEQHTHGSVAYMHTPHMSFI